MLLMVMVMVMRYYIPEEGGGANESKRECVCSPYDSSSCEPWKPWSKSVQSEETTKAAS